MALLMPGKQSAGCAELFFTPPVFRSALTKKPLKLCSNDIGTFGIVARGILHRRQKSKLGGKKRSKIFCDPENLAMPLIYPASAHDHRHELKRAIADELFVQRKDDVIPKASGWSPRESCGFKNVRGAPTGSLLVLLTGIVDEHLEGASLPFGGQY